MADFDRSLLFTQVIESGSLVAASRKLAISPSVVSKRLAELERHLGVQLLQRTTRSIKLTEAGQAYYTQMTAIAGLWQSMRDETASLGRDIRGRLVIAAPQPVLNRILLPKIVAFKALYPRLSLVMQAVDYADLPLFEADISICRQQPILDSAKIIAMPISRYRNRLFASPGYLQLAPKLNTLADLQQHQCLAYGLDHQLLWEFSAESPISLNNHLPMNNTELIISATLADQGIAYIPAMMIEQELADGRLREVLPQYHSNEFKFCAYYPKMDYLPHKVRLFLDFLKAEFA